MSEEESKGFVRKKIRFDSIDVHPVEKALIVFYEVEVIVVGEDGDPITGEKKECQKMIKVQSLNHMTDIIGLSKEIIHQCKLIPSSRLNEVQQLLSYLQQKPDKPLSGKMRPMSQNKNEDLNNYLNQTNEQSSMAKLDSYVELLYEDLNPKIRGTSLILQLAKQNENLQELVKNEALLGALCRVLREDGRRHYAVAINIAFTFFYFASYSSFHQTLTHFKVGSLLMELIHWELQRFDQWQNELQAVDYDQDGLSKKIQTALLQQTLLIRTSYYVLLHLSEEPNVEDKMRKKGIVQLLITTLQRQYHHSSVNELNYLVLTFLQKLSIFAENKEEMSKLGVVEKAALFVDSPHNLVRDAAARVLYNLSFDPLLRSRIGRLGLIPSLIRVMAEDNDGMNVAWALVYQISLDDRGRVLISRTECFAFVLEFLLRCRETRLPAIPIALAVNLSLVPKLGTELTQSKYFALFLDLAVSNQDAVVMKMLRNATSRVTSMNGDLGMMKKIIEVIFRNPDEHFQSEALGLLSNLASWCSSWSTLLKEKHFLNWLEEHIKPDMCPPDVQLPVILVLGSIAHDVEAGRQLLETDILSTLLNLLRSQQEDDEFVLQILYVFYRLTCHEEIRSVIIHQFEDIPSYMLDLMTDQNSQVRQVCESALQLISESDLKWQERMKNERFCWHNAQWLEAVAKSNLLSSGNEDADSTSSSMLGLCIRHADFLDHGSTSASSFGSPESRIGSPIESIENWDSRHIQPV